MAAAAFHRLLLTRSARVGLPAVQRTSPVEVVKRGSCSLVLAEKTQADFNCIAAAQQFNLPVDLLVAGPISSSLLSLYRRCFGLRRVLRCTDSSLSHLPADATSSLLFHLFKTLNPSYLCAAAGSLGKDVMPRFAAMVDVQPVTDVVQIKSPSEFVRAIYSGALLQTLRCKQNPKIITFTASAFSPVSLTEEECPEEIINFQGDTKIECIGEDIRDETIPELGTAKIVVAGGRGFRCKEDFHALLEPLRKKLNASLGATRAAVDLGFVSNDFQIGQSGQCVSADIYFAFGLSGAPQHSAGMKNSKCIVAVNKDPNAAIFKISDYYLVDDIYKIIPELTNKIKQQ